MELTQNGPDTHDGPHETGAARTAARPLLVQKKTFLKLLKVFFSDYYKFVFLHIEINNSCLVKQACCAGRRRRPFLMKLHQPGHIDNKIWRKRIRELINE